MKRYILILMDAEFISLGATEFEAADLLDAVEHAMQGVKWPSGAEQLSIGLLSNEGDKI